MEADVLVTQILNTKKSNGVVMVTHNNPVKEVADVLSARNIGSVVISSDGQIPEGIVSERDVVRAISKHGEAALEFQTSAIMTRNPYTCEPSATADDVLSLMTEKRFRHIPVMENGRLVGIITQGDVVKAKLSEVSMEKDALENMITGCW